MFQTSLFQRDNESNENSNHSARTGLTSDMRNMNKMLREQRLLILLLVNKKKTFHYGSLQIIIAFKKQRIRLNLF
jgi:hypothetical protein